MTNGASDSVVDMLLPSENVEKTAKSVGDLVTRIGLPVLLSLMFVGFLIWLTSRMMDSAEADKMFQREQTTAISKVLAENSTALTNNAAATREIKDAVNELKIEMRSK